MHRLRISLVIAVVLLASTAFAASRQSVLIRTPKPYDNVVKSIEMMGGTVTMKYQYVNAIAAEIPTSAMASVEKLVGAENLAKDEMMYIPENASRMAKVQGSIDDPEAAAIDASLPSDYSVEHVNTKMNQLFAAGYTGNGIVIAIIDSGFRPLYNHVPPARVLAGASFVPGEANALDNSNYPHGTQVAGIAAANIAFCFGSGVRFANEAVTLGSAAPGTGAAGNGCPTTSIRVPMIGSAPFATIYPVKVFPYTGTGSPSSRTLAAMEHVLAKRLAWDAGDHINGVNIKVLNMSLGGPTTYAGRWINDEMINKLLAADIVPVVSMGNEGFSTITGGAPGTAMGALTVGAAATPQNEWIYRAQFSSPCSTAALSVLHSCATSWRPDSSIQIADFSSRGPTHDGRLKPDVIAAGAYSFTQGSGTASTVNFVSGTSFSSPEVAGIAASLRQAVPTATARQIRNAIIMTAHPEMIPAGNVYDKGHGFVDAAAALALLKVGEVPDTYDTEFNYTRNLQANLSHAGITVYSDSVSTNLTDIKPAQTAEIAFQVPKNAATLNVRVRDITAGPSQNIFFGDDVYIAIQGNVVHDNDYRIEGEFDFIPAGAGKTYTFNRPEEGIWRITPMGDWTNKGNVSFGVDIWTTEEASPQFTAKARIGEGEQHAYTITVPPNTKELALTASWLNMTASYPINDLDVYLVPPGAGSTPVLDCATGKAPERCAVQNPAAGQWTVVVDGFSVILDGTPGDRETYTIRATADGTVLK